MTNDVIVTRWVFAALTVTLTLLALWYLRAARLDLAAVDMRNAQTAVRRAARGAVRLGWLRFVSGLMWIGFSVVILTAPPPTRWQGRVFLLVLIGIELWKIINDRWTRYGVDMALNTQATLGIVDTLAEAAEQRHHEVLSAVHGATLAAQAAYQEAHDVKITLSKGDSNV